MVLAPANHRLSEDLCRLLTGNDLFISAEAVRSLTSAVSLGNDICGPPHCSDKRPHASPGFTAQEEEEQEEVEEEARLSALYASQRETRPLVCKLDLLAMIGLTC